MVALLAFSLGLVFSRVLAAPSPISSRAGLTTASTTPISNKTISSTFVRPAQLSRIAYCASELVKSWSCGPACEVVDGVQVLQAGGDNSDTPRYFIAHDTSTDSIVLAHQGTNSQNILSILNDVELGLVNLNTTLIPQAPSGTQVHDGFRQTWLRTAEIVLAGVQSALNATGARKVLITGHSLGAAVASLDALMLKNALSPSIQIQTISFGLPRVGNQAWADLVGAQLGTSYIHITNQNDPVPTIPPRFLGFQHPQGEVHIVNGTDTPTVDAVKCPGQENMHCAEGNSLLQLSIEDHLGPYFDDISFGSQECPS